MHAPIQISLPTSFMVGPVNTYLLKEPEPILIDCGLKWSASQHTLRDGLAEHGLALSDIRRVVITHAHVDHIGAAGWLAGESGAEIWVSELVQAWATDVRDRWAERTAFIRGVLDKTGMAKEEQRGVMRYFRSIPELWDGVPTEQVRTFAKDGELEMGGGAWQVLHLPGHAAHQTGFWNAEHGWLFSADCLLPRTPVPVIEVDSADPTRRSPGLPLHIQSLKRLADLPVTCVYPGHGDPFDNHRALIRGQIERIHQRKEQCFALIQNGHATLPALTESMYGHYPPAGRFTGMSTVIGYLDLLKIEDRVTEYEVDGVWHYATN